MCTRVLVPHARSGSPYEEDGEITQRRLHARSISTHLLGDLRSSAGSRPACSLQTGGRDAEDRGQEHPHLHVYPGRSAGAGPCCCRESQRRGGGRDGEEFTTIHSGEAGRRRALATRLRHQTTPHTSMAPPTEERESESRRDYII